MPSWSIHLNVAKKLNETLKLDKDLFYYGNLIPDVDYSDKINRFDAHYYDINLQYPTVPKENMIDINKFLEDYKDKLNNPLIIGYYTHLLTDLYFNEIIYNKCWVQDKDNNIIGIRLKNNKVINIDTEDKNNLRKKYKHGDLELYGKYIFNNIELPSNRLIIKDTIKKLNIDFLDDDLVDKRFEYLNNKFYKDNKLSLKEKIFKHKYKLFYKKEIDNMFEDCIKYIINNLKKENLI